jgi:osmotically-inducible protein OsmY
MPYGIDYRNEYEPGPRRSMRGLGPKNYQRSDDRIREDVCERLTEADDVDATNLEVTVSAGTVTLSGNLDERWAKRRAEDIAESVVGVRDVDNRIRVERSAGA